MRHEVQGRDDLNHVGETWNLQTTSRRKIESMADIGSIRSYAAQKIDFIVENLIAAGTVTLLTGDSGSGKSTLLTAIGSAVELGIPFAGMATQRRSVLFLDRENPLSIVVERFDRLGIDDSPTFVYWGGWCPDEAPVPFSPFVIRWVEQTTPKPLIMVDSFISFHDGDENDATETRAYMQGFRRLADLGATVVVSHHSGKGESSREYRGSSDIKASIDVGYLLTNMGDSSRLTSLRLRAWKARFGAIPREMILHYESGSFRADNRTHAPERATADVLRSLLFANPGALMSDFEELAVAKDISRGKARQFLKDGIASRAVDVFKGKHNRQHHTWIGLPESSEDGSSVRD